MEFDLNDERLLEHLYEWADSNTPIYYSELAQWFSKNWTAIDEYIECFGSSPKMEIMQIIQATYCWTLEQSMQTALQNIKEKAVQ